MESPESRPPAAKLIDSVIDEHYAHVNVGIYGWSLAMKIYDALLRNGYLKED